MNATVPIDWLLYRIWVFISQLMLLTAVYGCSNLYEAMRMGGRPQVDCLLYFVTALHHRYTEASNGICGSRKVAVDASTAN